MIEIFSIPINWWLVLGFAGQGLYFARFFIQWLHSERQGESTIPVSFWYFSIAGASIIFIYAIYREDPVIILGQGVAVAIYLRNLVLVKRKQKRDLEGEL